MDEEKNTLEIEIENLNSGEVETVQADLDAQETDLAENLTTDENQTASEDNKVPEEEEKAESKSKSKSKAWEWVVFGIGLAIILALIALVSFRKIRTADYEAAQDLFASGNYEEALEKCGKYTSNAECSELAEECRKNIAYNEAELEYTQSMGNLDKEGVSEAKEIFESLGEFKNSAEMANQCGEDIIYLDNKDAFDEADEKFAKGDDENLKEALEIYKGITEGERAASQAKLCQDKLNLSEATKLAEAGDYEGALKILGGDSVENVEGYDDFVVECTNKLAYANGQVAFDMGYQYSAYKYFMSIPDYEDAAERAQACIQEEPWSCELYRNENYYGAETSLKYNNKGFTSTCIKVCSGSDTVSVFFVRSNESVTIYLPVGTYSIEQCYGENWFGGFEMYGDDGDYYKCKVGDLYDIKLDWGFAYTISSEKEGYGIDNTEVEYEKF